MFLQKIFNKEVHFILEFKFETLKLFDIGDSRVFDFTCLRIIIHL